MFGERAARTFASLMLRSWPFNWPGPGSEILAARRVILTVKSDAALASVAHSQAEGWVCQRVMMTEGDPCQLLMTIESWA